MEGDVRYGIIGTGMMGLEHLRNLLELPGAAVTAIADPNPGSRDLAAMTVERLAGRAALPQAFSDHRQLIESGLCDAVVVSSPNMTHAAVLLDVLEAGLHVLVEKPLCTTVGDCRRVIDAAATHRGVVWVGLEYRYMPPVAALLDAVHAGTIGTVRMAAIREHRFPFLPKVGDWNRFNRNSGGTLVEKCCHFFDLMRQIVGTDPVRVLASGAQDVNHLDESYGGETPDILDNAYVIVDFDGGARALLDLCMFGEVEHFREDIEVRVTGDAGHAVTRVTDATLRIGRRPRHGGGVEERVVHDDRVRHQGFHHGSSYLEHLDFLAAIRSGADPAVGLDDGLWSVAMGVAAHRSIDEGRAVTLDEVLGAPQVTPA